MYLMRKTFAFAGSFFLLGTMIAFLVSILLLVIAGSLLADLQLEHQIIQAKEHLSLLKHQAFLRHRISR